MEEIQIIAERMYVLIVAMQRQNVELELLKQTFTVQLMFAVRSLGIAVLPR